mgnify:CR=1 FL=1
MIRTLTLLLILMTHGAMADPVSGAAQALNGLRAQNGLPPVALSPRLQKAAEAHASDMAKRGYFSHRGANGTTIGTRVKRTGYRFCFVAENIAKGQKTLAEVMESWANSAGHRRNMLSDQARDFGLARASGNVWVMVLGRAGC